MGHDTGYAVIVTSATTPGFNVPFDDEDDESDPLLDILQASVAADNDRRAQSDAREQNLENPDVVVASPPAVAPPREFGDSAPPRESAFDEVSAPVDDDFEADEPSFFMDEDDEGDVNDPVGEPSTPSVAPIWTSGDTGLTALGMGAGEPYAPDPATEPDTPKRPPLPNMGEDNTDDDDDFLAPKSSFMDKIKDLSPLSVLDKHPGAKRPIIVGAAGLVVALVVAFIFGGSPGSDTPAPTTPPAVADDPESGDPTNVEVITLMPKAVSASCPSGSTSPSLAFTPKPEDAWLCGRANGIDGAVMNIQFVRTVMVRSVCVMPGWNYVSPNGKDYWNEHRLVTKILWRLGGRQFVQDINPTRTCSTFTFPGSGVGTTVMSMTILRTERPNAVDIQGDESLGGGLLPGGESGDPGEVDKSTAISSVVISGTET